MISWVYSQLFFVSQVIEPPLSAQSCKSSFMDSLLHSVLVLVSARRNVAACVLCFVAGTVLVGFLSDHWSANKSPSPTSRTMSASPMISICALRLLCIIYYVDISKGFCVGDGVEDGHRYL